MRRWNKSVVLVTVVAFFAISLLGSADDRKKTDKAKAAKAQKEEVMKNYYKKWLEEDVVYLITPEEKDTFKKLSTDEERDQFIEQFWQRRNPDPKSPFNSFKEEFYRRVSYANEHFSSGIPGWKTDRGMVYIKFGKPDHIEDYAYGDAYDRPAWEGLGTTTVFPTQIWEYRSLPGVGTDVELEFVDQGGGNLYTLTRDPYRKDIQLHSSSGGQTFDELYGSAGKIDRVSGRTENGERPGAMFRGREQDSQFYKAEVLAAVSKPPEIQYKDLKAIVTTSIKYEMFPFDVRADYIKVSEQQVMVPITLRLDNRELSFKEQSYGYARGAINFYGIITTLSNKFVNEFEDDIERVVKVDELDSVRKESSRYQKFLLLNSGVYKLSLVVKDLNSGRLSTIDLRLDVPFYKKEQLNGSSLILTSQISKMETSSGGLDQFVLGDLKVVPDFDRKFRPADPLWVYLQVYNMGIDQSRLEPDVNVDFIVERNGKEFYKYQDLKGSTFKFVSGDRLIITGRMPIKRFLPGKYILKIRVQDNISGKTMERLDYFEIIS